MAEPIFAAFVDGKPILLSVEQLRAMLGVVDVPALPPSSDALAAVVDVANAAARETMANVALAFDRADAIEIDTAALKDARAVLDAAVEELRSRGTVADAALRALDALAVDGEAARRQIERDAGRLSAASLQMLLVANRTQEILRDAGIIVDQASGRVYIYAVDQLGGRINAVSQTLDAQAAQIRTKASSNEVDEKILRAVLNPEQIAQLEPLIARIAAVEVVTDGLRAEVATRASLIELTAAVGRITDVEQLASATDGLVRSKVSQTAFDAAMVRLGSAEMALQAYGDVSRYAIELRQARAAAADTSRGLLASVLAGDAATIREITAQGDLRQELYSKITGVGSDLAVEVRARTTLVATVASMDARSVQDRLTFAKADQALAQDIDALGVRSSTQDLAIATLQRASLTQAGGIAGIETAIRQQARGSSDADRALLAGVIAGDEATRRANNSLAEVQVQLTTTMLAGFDASAVARQALRARINDADARFATETKATADRLSAVAQSLTTLEASFGAQSGEIAAAKAEIARLEKVAADDKAATLQLIDGLRTSINDPATGLPKTRADLTALTELVATQNSAAARRLDSLEAALFDGATGLAATSARLDREVSLSAERDGARGRQVEALSATINNPTTGLPGAFAGIATERDARVAQDEVQARETSGLRAIINDPATGLPGLSAGLVTEREARVADSEAQARLIEGLRAIFNDPATGLPGAFAGIATERDARVAGDEAQARSVQVVEAGLATERGRITQLAEVVVGPDGTTGRAVLAMDVNGRVSGTVQTNDGKRAGFSVLADEFVVVDPDGNPVFYVDKNRAIAASFQPSSIGFEELLISSLTRHGFDDSAGGTATAFGQTNTLSDFAIDLGVIQPAGTITVKFIGAVSKQFADFTTTYNGRPAYGRYVVDGGGFEIFCTDDEGHTYSFNGERYLDQVSILATKPFRAILRARVRRGSTNTGWVADGDYYYQDTAQAFSVTAFTADARWTAF